MWLVAEKQETYIEQWIQTCVPLDVGQALGKTTLTRCASLWRSLVAAEFNLNARQTKSADTTVEKVLSTSAYETTEHRPVVRHLSNVGLASNGYASRALAWY